jgi:5-methylcytosine-specific restriction enzyme subunit McrC
LSHDDSGREYALLTSDNSQPASMDLGIVSEATFSWLEQLQQKWSGTSQILSREGRRFLRLGSYVGYLQSPTGESIEILPKTTLDVPAEIVPSSAFTPNAQRLFWDYTS